MRSNFNGRAPRRPPKFSPGPGLLRNYVILCIRSPQRLTGTFFFQTHPSTSVSTAGSGTSLHSSQRRTSESDFRSINMFAEGLRLSGLLDSVRNMWTQG